MLLNLVKSHLKIDHEYEDCLIGMYLEAAKDWCQQYLDLSIVDVASSADQVSMTPSIQAAILLKTADLYENRSPEECGKNEAAILSLLHPYRNMGV